MSRTLNDKLFNIMPSGFSIIRNNQTHTGRFCALQVVQTPDFPANTTANSVDGEGVDLSALNGLLPAGYVIWGDFDHVTLSSGSIIAYRG